MMADICDDDELKNRQRREGVFGAVFSWLEKMVVSVAFLGTGLALTASGFSPELGGDQAQNTFTSMRLFLAGAPTITAVMAIITVYYYPIDETRANLTRQLLEKRKNHEIR